MIGLDVDFQTGLPRLKNQVWTQVDGTLTALQANAVIDSLFLSEFDHLKYIMSFKGSTQDDVRTLQMTVQQKDGAIVEQVYNKMGTIKIDLVTNINGSSFELLATNTENFAVEYCLTVLTL